ncbi:MAG: amylo-alpha-1,6-glucosidase, partial [Candidatus Methanospirareceae archaeon]
MNFYVSLPPIEDVNPARTKHILLKRPQASLSQSVFSVPFGNSLEKVIPNRDYPYEGLSVIIEGENFHFLDGIAVGAKEGGRYVKLRAREVKASPWRAVYYYGREGDESAKIDLSVSYYLCDMDSLGIQEGISMCVFLESTASSLVIEPIVDIRHMYDESAPEKHVCQPLRDGMLIFRDGKYLSLRVVEVKKNMRLKVKGWKKHLEWWYKLGSGFREKGDGEVIFKGERRYPMSFGEIEVALHPISLNNTPISPSSITFIVSCGNSEKEVLTKIGKGWREDMEREEERARKVTEKLNLHQYPEVAFRALALLKYGIYVDGKFFFDAGDFWFRAVWFRDQFEAILNNIHTLLLLGYAERLKEIVLHAFEYQDAYGRIPNRFSERKGEGIDYNSADATLLAFIVAGEIFMREKDRDFAKQILRKADLAISKFKMNDKEKENGAPVLNDNGLLSSVPRHTWTEKWNNEIISMFGGEEEFNKPKFFLIEINAQWLKMLRYCEEMSSFIKDYRRRKKYRGLLEVARRSFREVFW